jgi:flagellar basal-body rod modification protein FlgD
MGRDAFLTLLVTQLRNQDPLSPLQPHEFAAQLAQFTSVEQLTQLNTAMSSQGQQTQLMSGLIQTQFGAGLLGRDVLAESDRIEIPSSGSAKLTADVGGSGGVATLNLTDDKGHIVATRDLGSLPPGRQVLTLPSDLPPGKFHVAIAVEGAGGSHPTVKTYLDGTVGGIDFSGSEVTLRIGGIDVPLSSLLEIRPGTP